jgi:hypothetical protein
MNPEERIILHRALKDFLIESNMVRDDYRAFETVLEKFEKVIDNLLNIEMGKFLSRYSIEN